MNSVAAGAIGDGLGAALGRQAVEGRVEADQPVVGHSELAGEADVSVATSAGVADVTGIDAAGSVGVLEDFVFAVAICAQWRLGHAARQGLAVHAGAELFHDVGVAHAAGIWNGGAGGLGFWRQQFVRTAVAQRAIGRALVAALTNLAVDALVVITNLIDVASKADKLRNIRKVGNFFM